MISRAWNHVQEATQAVRARWSGVPRVGIDDGFFELGGDSILSLKLLAQADQAGLHVSLHDLFQYGTVRQLARLAYTGQTKVPAWPHTAPFELLTVDQRASLPKNAVDAYPLTRLQAGTA